MSQKPLAFVPGFRTHLLGAVSHRAITAVLQNAAVIKEREQSA